MKPRISRRSANDRTGNECNSTVSSGENERVNVDGAHQTVEFENPHAERYIRRLKKQKGRSSSTFYQNQRACELYELFLSDCGLSIEAATPLDVEDFLLELNDEEYSDGTTNKRYMGVSRLYTSLIEKYDIDGIDSNSCDPVTPSDLDVSPESESGDVRKSITEDEKDAMIEKLSDGNYYVRNCAIVETL